MADALAQVKTELGREAVILHTRTVQRGGILGLGARPWVEITATADPRVGAIRAAVAQNPEGERRVDPNRAREGAVSDPSRAREGAVSDLSRARVGAVRDAEREEQKPEHERAAAPHPFTLIDWAALPPDRDTARPEGRGSTDTAPPEVGGSPPVDADVDNGEAQHSTAVDRSASHVGHGGPTLPARTEPCPTGADPVLRTEVTEIRTMVRDLLRQADNARRPAVPAELVDYYTQLVSQDVAQQLAAQLLEGVAVRLQEHGAAYWDQHGRFVSGGKPTPDWIRAELERHIVELLPPAAPLSLAAHGRPTVVALVGPTGVGKTTTVAKLAANMKLREGRRVGLITIDTYRIAAVEQLKTYAEILQVPLVAVTTPEEMQQAVRQMADADLVLIDTAGRSQKDELRIADLRRFLAAIEPDQVHLVLSSTSREEAIREAIRNFSVLGVQHVIFTKLDEAVGFGVLLNVLRSVDLKLSYLTTGQSVPADIEPGCAQRVAQLLLTGRLDAAPAGEGPCKPARSASEGELEKAAGATAMTCGGGS
jgi:flagellar biosynthesis protein FlhF